MRAVSTCPDFSRARVLVVGDLMLDRYWSGPTRRISPEAPVPVVHVLATEDRPGGAGNVALNIAALGGCATLLGLVGDDEAAASLRTRLEAAGVRCDFEVVAGASTITKLRVMSRHQQLMRLDFEDGFDAFDTPRLETRFTALLPEADVVLFSDYAKGCLAGVAALIGAARAAGKPVLVDPKGLGFGRYRGASLITPNESEFADEAGRWTDDAGLAERASGLAKAFDFSHVLVTRSERGMTLVDAAGAAEHIGSKAREVFDVTGAGDTVIAVIAAALAAGSPLVEATWLANVAAGIVVGKLGTATVSATELKHALIPARADIAGIVDESQLLIEVAAARARGERLVMTNGVFDLLHAGHVRYLAEAAALGDRLVVAVNDDASVRRLGKGPERPINSLAERMTVLAALGAVDWVVPFGTDTPRELIARVLPDVLVKGGDYRPEDIAGGAEVIANGGEVVVLGFVDGQSTSGIVARIRER